MLKDVTADEVIREADIIVKQAVSRLVKDEEALHNAGYHDYHRILGDMRTKVETAFSELVDELTEGD